MTREERMTTLPMKYHLKVLFKASPWLVLNYAIITALYILAGKIGGLLDG